MKWNAEREKGDDDLYIGRRDDMYQKYRKTNK